MARRLKDKEVKLRNILDITDSYFYEDYKKNRKNLSKNVCRETFWITCINTISKSIQTLMLEKEGGVILNDIGYFSYLMMPKKVRRINSFKSKFVYEPYFFGLGIFKDWTMEGTFPFKIRTPKSSNNLKKRELHYTLFNNIKIKL
jgi:hypothetical protein